MHNSDDIAKKQRWMKKIHDDAFKIEVEVLENGTLPTKAHPTDAGFDLYATEDISIAPGQVIKHPLNIRVKFPRGVWGRIETKSGLGSKGMLVWAGVIDEGYRGVPHVICTNLNYYDKEYYQGVSSSMQYRQKNIAVKKGEKIAQMTINPHNSEFFVEQVESVDTDTDRGDGGFGSSGK